MQKSLHARWSLTAFASIGEYEWVSYMSFNLCILHTVYHDWVVVKVLKNTQVSGRNQSVQYRIYDGNFLLLIFLFNWLVFFKNKLTMCKRTISVTYYNGRQSERIGLELQILLSHFDWQGRQSLQESRRWVAKPGWEQGWECQCVSKLPALASYKEEIKKKL